MNTYKDYIMIFICMIAVIVISLLEVIIRFFQWIHDSIPTVLDILFFDCLGWSHRKNDEIWEGEEKDEGKPVEQDNI